MKVLRSSVIALMLLSTDQALGWPTTASPIPRSATQHILIAGPGEGPSLGSPKGCNIDDMAGVSGSQIPLAANLLPGSLNESGTFFLSNLPDRVTLTNGVKVRNLWALTPKDAGRTQLVVAPGAVGRFAIRLQCFIGGRQFEDVAMLTIEALPVTPMVGVITLQPAAPQESNQAEILDAHPLMRQAEELLKAGDIARARLYFEHLAMKGSPRAALSLGSTYDPAFLATIANHGVAANLELAVQWYRLADDLGVAEARNKLSALGK
jgi:hypothetical protein